MQWAEFINEYMEAINGFHWTENYMRLHFSWIVVLQWPYAHGIRLGRCEWSMKDQVERLRDWERLCSAEWGFYLTFEYFLAKYYLKLVLEINYFSWILETHLLTLCTPTWKRNSISIYRYSKSKKMVSE